MLSALRRTNSTVLKYHIMLEPLEFRFAKDKAKDKDKVLPGPVILVWEKSPRLSKTKPLDASDGKVVWPPAPQLRPLELMITMYKKDNKFLSKKTSLKAKIITAKNDEKTIGKCEIDVADYCVDKEISHPIVDIKMGGDCVIKCRLHSRPVPQGASGGGDDISMMSGLSNLEEPSTASDWAVGFGKNAKPEEKKGVLDSDSDSDEDDDDDDVMNGFGVQHRPPPKQQPIPDDKDESSEDEFIGIAIPNVKDDPTIVAPGPQIDEVEISKVMTAEIIPTSPIIDIPQPTQIDTNIDDDAISKLQSSTDHQQCEEFISKYKTQVEQLLRENGQYHSQLQVLQRQHSQDIERFQGIVTLSQTSLNKMQDVVGEYKKREENYQLQLTTLQQKVKADEKQWSAENKRLLKDSQIQQQDITILNSKISTLKETIRHKEEAEQRLVIQMKTTGDTESILLGEKTQLEKKLQESENHTKMLDAQLIELMKERDQKVTAYIELDKSLEKLKTVMNEYEIKNNDLQSKLSDEKEHSLVLQQQLAQLEHNLAVKDKELDAKNQLVIKKDNELSELKSTSTTTATKLITIETQLSEVLKQFSTAQDRVYELESQQVTLKQQNDALVIENKNQQDVHDKLQADLKAASDQHKGLDIQALQQQLTMLQSTVSSLEQFKSQSIEKEKSYQEQIQVLQQEKSKLTTTISTQDKDMVQMKNEHESLITKSRQFESTIAQQNTQYDELYTKYTAVEPQLQEQQKQNIELKTTLQSIEDANKKLQSDNKGLLVTQQQLRDQIVELELDNVNYKSTVIPQLEKSIKEHKDMIETKSQTIEHNETEIAALSAALEALKSSKSTSSHQAALAASSSPSPTSTVDLVELEEGYERIATSELTRIRDEISFLTTTLDKRTDKIEKLNTEIERLHEEHEEFLQLRQQMEEDFGELEHDRDELDQKLNVIMTKFEVLQQQNEKLKTQQNEVDQDEYKKLHQEYDTMSEQYQQVKERNEQLKVEVAKLKNELNHTESLVTDLNTKLNITATRLENSEANCKNVLEKSTELASQLNNELTRAHLENRSLRDRIYTFDTLTATVTAIISNSPQLKGAKLESRIVEELIQKIDYYGNQLAEADETLLQTKQTWKQTSDVLTRRILDLEGQLKQLQKEKIDLEHARGQDEGEQSKMKNIVSQQQQKQEKYQEALSKFEIQLIAKRVEITELTKERDMYKEQVEMYENNIESYEAQINASRLEVEQLRETLAAVSGTKKSKKSSSSNKKQQQQQQEYDLDDADF